MKKWLTRCALAAALIGIVLLVVVSQSHPPGIWMGKPLPPGKVRPQLVNAGFYDMLLAPDGSLWAWGGLFNRGVPASLSLKDSFSRIPQRVGSDSNWRQVACCQSGPVALKNDGSLWIWGFKQSGPNPTRIGTETNWSQICVDWNGHNLWLKTDGSIWTWDPAGHLMSGSSTNTNGPPVPRMIGSDRDWRMIATGGKSNFALKSNGTLWEWEIEEGAGSNPLKPRQVTPNTNWQAISASYASTFLALKTDGTIWTTTSNLANVASGLVPDLTRELTQVGPDTDWTEFYAGRGCFYARKKDGSWWASGWNVDAQLGWPTKKIKVVVLPQRLPFDFDAWAISEPMSHTIMLGKDGKLWSWGVRLGIRGSGGAWKKFEALVAPAVKRFPSLGFLIKSNILIDRTPHLLWELPPEVRRSLGSEPKSDTNNFTN
jgi:alpha-tubulin suppressor-like RCC1 family protein